MGGSCSRVYRIWVVVLHELIVRGRVGISKEES